MKPQQEGIARERAGGRGEVRGNLTSSARRACGGCKSHQEREAGCLLWWCCL